MRRSLLIVAAISLAACAKGVDLYAPQPIPTLLVTNATCVMGTCDSVRVLAFPGNQPNTPGGLWSIDVGVMTTAQQCFVLPATSRFYVISAPVRSSADTTTFVWTNREPVSLAAQSASAGVLRASPTTAAFIPGTAGGWAITFPTDTAVRVSGSCTP